MPRRAIIDAIRRLVRDPEVVQRLTGLERELKLQQKLERRLLRHSYRTREQLESLLRYAYIAPEDLPYPERLNARRFGILSQNSEDGLVLALVREAGSPTRTFVEVGCGNNGGNSGFLARELGWSGIMIDGSEDALAEAALRFNSERVRFVHAFVTRENLDSLLRENGVGSEVDFLSIDIDGNDLWVWEGLTACSPRVVSVEFNAVFGPERSVAVPYAADWQYESGSDYFGASLTALARLAARTGYRLVSVEPRGANAFFLREDVATHIGSAEPKDVYFPLLAPHTLYDEIGSERTHGLATRQARLEAEIEAGNRPLVEVA
jgi:hypothetical protein